MAEHICPPWLNFLLINPIRRWSQNPGKALRRFIEEGDVVLDAGCGPGHFTLAMAEIVGPGGVVIASDIQEKMLRTLKKRALKAGVLSRIRTHLSSRDSLGLLESVDFVLVSWMLHEVRDKNVFLGQVRECMKPDASLLLIEPKWHVKQEEFNSLIEIAEKSGLRVLHPETIPMSYAMLLGKV